VGQQYRSIWISDVHLGTRACKAEFLLDFFRHTESEFLYLVGDIVDGWRLRRSWYWEQSHNDVIQKTLRKARKGTRVLYIPGNHDDWLRDYADHEMGGIELQLEAVHVTADQRRLLITHGDAFDAAVTYARWLVRFGDHASEWMLALNHLLNRARRGLGLPYWSLSGFVKANLTSAADYISAFERVVADEARRHHFDGVVCGHIHQPRIRDIDGVLYCNDGDWVENCTALAEHFDGRLEILEWAGVHTPELPLDDHEAKIRETVDA
jgi:UDP-2,3-diacylglucosamine pyrophosphatase LpxH